MVEKIWTVQDSDLLLRWTRDELHRLEYQSLARSLPPDCDFPFPSNPDRYAFLVTEGRLVATTVAEHHKRSVEVELTTSDFFGVVTSVDSATLGSTLRVAERSTIVSIPRETLQPLLNARARLQNSAWAFSWGLPKQFRRALVENFFLPTSKRLAKFLFELVADNYVATGVWIDGLSNRVLAKLLNSTAAVVEACLEDFQREEILFRQGNRLEIFNLTALADSTRMEIREPLRSGSSGKVFR